MARRSTPRLPPEARREQLLDVTLRLARRRGMDGLSIEAVAREAGITRPPVYALFGDFDGLLDALAAREEARALADVTAAIPVFPDEDDPDEVLERGVRLFIDAVRAEPDRWHLILLPPDGTPERLRRRIERNRSAILDQLAELVSWGLRRRGGPEVDAELMARVILTLAQDAARLVLSDPARYTTDRIAGFTRSALAAFERGAPDLSAPAPRFVPPGAPQGAG